MFCWEKWTKIEPQCCTKLITSYFRHPEAVTTTALLTEQNKRNWKCSRIHSADFVPTGPTGPNPKDHVCKFEVDICTKSTHLFPNVWLFRKEAMFLHVWYLKLNIAVLFMLVRRYDARRTVYGWLAGIPPSPWLAAVSQSHASGPLLPQWNSPKKVRVSTWELLSEIPPAHCTSFACLLSHTVANCNMLSW